MRAARWGRDASSDEHLVGTKHGLLKCRSVRGKPPGEQRSRRETVEALGPKFNFDVEMDSGISGPPVTSRRDEGMPRATAPMEIPTVPPLVPFARRARAYSGSEPSGRKSAELLDARHVRRPVRRSHTLVSRCLGREPPNRISGGGGTWNCWRSRYTTAGPEWKFGGSRAKEIKNNLCDKQREPS